MLFKVSFQTITLWRKTSIYNRPFFSSLKNSLTKQKIYILYYYWFLVNMDQLVKMEQITKYQYITGCRTAYFNIWCKNCQPGKTITET